MEKTMAGKGSAKGDDGVEAGSGMSLPQTAIAFAVAGVIAAGAGGFQGYQTARPDSAMLGVENGGVAKAKDERKYAPVLEMGSIDLPPVVTNLAAPSEVWVRVEASLIFEGKTLPHGEALAGEIAGDILAFMRTVTLPQIQGVAGLQHLRQDLAERVATRSEGKVREIVIRSLVVQ
jgi:flagellar FliL protein